MLRPLIRTSTDVTTVMNLDMGKKTIHRSKTMATRQQCPCSAKAIPREYIQLHVPYDSSGAHCTSGHAFKSYPGTALGHM